jgi:hypothetical protein
LVFLIGQFTLHTQAEQIFCNGYEKVTVCACFPRRTGTGEGGQVWTNCRYSREAVKVWIKDLAIEVLLCKFVFTNKDGSTGEMYLISNDLTLSADDFQTLYKKRWGVEEYHKSFKQNAFLAKSPTRTVTTQINHLFALLLAYIKLEKLKFVHKLNHFALKSNIYFCARKYVWKELEAIKYYELA